MNETGNIFFERTGRIEVMEGDRIIFQSSDGTTFTNQPMKVMNDIDFKFRCSFVSNLSTTNADATVSILGLSRETIQNLCTYMPRGLEMQRRRRVRVYASYKSYGDNLIFDGDIVSAVPSIPPNNWLTIDAFVGNYRRGELFSITETSSSLFGLIKRSKNLTVKKLIENVATAIGMKVHFDITGSQEELDELNRSVRGFNCSGTKQDLYTMINRISDFRVYEMGDGILTAKYISATGGVPKSRQNVVVISEGTGMIGVPKILAGTADKGKCPPLQVEVTSFINPSIKMWDSVLLKSIYVPGANGTYTVMKIEYSGHLRGKEWYMKMLLSSAYSQ